MRVERIQDATLYLADCRTVLPTLGRVDAVVTDPPYGVGFADWDQNVVSDWLPIIRQLAKTVMVTPGITNAFLMARPDWIASYSYPIGMKRAKGGGFNAWEPVFIYGKNTLPIDSKQFSPVASERIEGHECAKPLAPIQWLVASGTSAAETILDPFMGSGTTGVACANLGRRFIGIEIEEKYFDIAVRRIEQAYRQPRLFAEPAPKPQQVSLLEGAA